MDQDTKAREQPRPGGRARDPAPRHDEALDPAATGTGSEGGRTSASNRPCKSTTPQPVGGYRWRKAKGLLTWRDCARRWRALRFTPDGARSPLPGPEYLLPAHREVNP